MAHKTPINIIWVFQVVLVEKNQFANAGDLRDTGFIPGLGRSLGEGNDNPLQYSSLENPMDRISLVGYSPQGCKGLEMTKATCTHACPILLQKKQRHDWMKGSTGEVQKGPEFRSVCGAVFCQPGSSSNLFIQEFL